MMNIQADKLRLLKMLLDTEDESVLNQIKSILESQYSGKAYLEWDDEVKADVEEALAELERGEGIPHNEVMSEFAKWRKK